MQPKVVEKGTPKKAPHMRDSNATETNTTQRIHPTTSGQGVDEGGVNGEDDPDNDDDVVSHEQCGRSVKTMVMTYTHLQRN